MTRSTNGQCPHLERGSQIYAKAQSITLSITGVCEQRQAAWISGKTVPSHHSGTGVVGGRQASLPQQHKPKAASGRTGKWSPKASWEQIPGLSTGPGAQGQKPTGQTVFGRRRKMKETL